MIASILIIVFSLILLIYWFRYTCILLLKDKPEHLDAAAVLKVSGYRIVQQSLETEPKLEKLHLVLKRDFEVLTYLTQHASGMELSPMEHKLLLIDYKLMQWQYRLTKSLLPGSARRALGEMASVTDAIASRIAIRSAVKTQAAS